MRDVPVVFREDFRDVLALLPTSDMGQILLSAEVFQALGGHYGLPPGGVAAWEHLLRAVADAYNRGLHDGREAKKAWKEQGK